MGILRGNDRTDGRRTREAILNQIRGGGVEILGPDRPGRYLLITKVDDDSLSDRRATFHRTAAEVRDAINRVPPGWWPDCVIDIEAPVTLAVRDASVADGSLGDPHPFDEEHVIFA